MSQDTVNTPARARSRDTLSSLRALWFQVHLWVGLATFILLIPICLTGSILVFHEPLERLVHPARFEVTDGVRPVADYVAAADGVLAEGERVTRVSLPGPEGGPVVVSAPMPQPEGAPRRGRPPQHQVFIDPGTAAVLDEASSQGGIFRFMHQLHGSLMIPGVGRKIVGWLGWLLLASALTGLWLWWPRRGPVRKGLKWERSPLLSGRLHHTVGFWSLIPVVLLALTGAYISFPQTMRAWVGPLVGAEAEAPGRGPGGRGGGRQEAYEARLSPDAAIATAIGLDAHGDLPLAQIGWPEGGREAEWTITFREGERSVAIKVPDDGSAPEAEAGRADPAQGVARLMRRLHDGVGLPLIYQLIIFVGGLAPLLLGVTGVLMWLRLRGGRKAIERARREAAAAA